MHGWMTSKMDQKRPPPKSAFNPALTQESITDEEYKRAETVYDALNFYSFQDNHMTNLKSDRLMLIDVFGKVQEHARGIIQVGPRNLSNTSRSSMGGAMLLQSKY